MEGISTAVCILSIQTFVRSFRLSVRSVSQSVIQLESHADSRVGSAPPSHSSTPSPLWRKQVCQNNTKNKSPNGINSVHGAENQSVRYGIKKRIRSNSVGKWFVRTTGNVRWGAAHVGERNSFHIESIFYSVEIRILSLSAVGISHGIPKRPFNPLPPKGFCIFEAIFWIHTPHELSWLHI